MENQEGQEPQWASEDFGIKGQPGDEQILEVDSELLQEIVSWAINAGALAMLMETAPKTEDEVLEERFEQFMHGVHVMLENIPEAIVPACRYVAITSLEEAADEERQVAEFREAMRFL